MSDEQNQEMELDYRVSRSRVFVLLDGTFVVRWQPNRVQELKTGMYRPYTKRDYGAAVSDFELNQLQDVGIVETFDDEHVILCEIPEQSRMPNMTAWEQNRTRSYYINTTLPGEQLGDVARLLAELNAADDYYPRDRDDFVVLWSSRGMSFHSFEDAERARERLTRQSTGILDNMVVAFIETSKRT